VANNAFDFHSNYFELLPVEAYVRGTAQQAQNIYIVVFFACCREIFPIPNAKKKEVIKAIEDGTQGVSRGNTASEQLRVQNYVFSFGCSPGAGVRADTKLAQNFIEVLTQNFHITSGHVHLPSVFNKIISSDANIETVASNLAQEV